MTLARKFDHVSHGFCSLPAQLQVEVHASISERNVTQEVFSSRSNKFVCVPNLVRNFFAVGCVGGVASWEPNQARSIARRRVRTLEQLFHEISPGKIIPNS